MSKVKIRRTLRTDEFGRKKERIKDTKPVGTDSNSPVKIKINRKETANCASLPSLRKQGFGVAKKATLPFTNMPAACLQKVFRERKVSASFDKRIL
ncbi:MAG: hypothetical protein IKA44_06345 [Clostridia bacterium]|nr:hypothetical protein [Clostridia bacterium]